MNNSVPKDWQVSKIGELIQKVIDNRGKTPPLSDKGKELIEINCIENYKFPNYDLIKKYVSNKTYNSWFRGGHPKKGDILVSTVGSIGQFSIMNDNRGCIAQNIIAITPKKNICNDYLYYACSSDIIKKAISSVLMGAVQPSLKVPDFLAINLHLPSLPEQKKIVSILTSVDNVIEKIQAQINKLQDLKKSVMNELLTKGIGHTEFKESRLEKIPKSWEIKKLQDIGFFKNGINKSKENFGFGTHLISISDVYNINLNYEKLNKVHVSNEEIEEYKLQVGDIIFVRSSVKPDGVGYPLMFKGFNHPVVFSGFMIRFRFNKNEYDPLYLKYFMEFDEFRIKLMKVATISANTNINQVALSKLKISLPKIFEQKNISKTLLHFDNYIQLRRKKLSKIKKLKKSLIQDLLTGKVRVSVN